MFMNIFMNNITGDAFYFPKIVVAFTWRVSVAAPSCLFACSQWNMGIIVL